MFPVDDQHFDVESSVPPTTPLPDYRRARVAEVRRDPLECRTRWHAAGCTVIHYSDGSVRHVVIPNTVR